MMTLRLWHYCVSSEDEHPDDVSLGDDDDDDDDGHHNVHSVQPLVMQVGLKFHD